MVNYDFLSVYFYSVPNLRFNNDPYKKYNLYEFATRVTRKNKDNVSNLPLTISAQYGLVDQVSFFNKTVASKDMSGYYLLKNGEFAYNKSYSNDYPWGAIKRLDLYDMGCLSTLYICFKTNDNIVNSNYLVHYFESSKWHKQVADIAGEGARNHGLLNIVVNDFFNTKHAVPTIENQIKIAGFLDLIEKRIQTQIKIIDSYFSLSKAISNTLIGQSKGNTRLRECLNCYSSNTMESVIKQEDLGDYPVYGANGIIKKINNYEIEYPSIAIVKDGSGVGKIFKLSGKYSILSTLNYLTSKPGYDIDYIYYALKQKSLKKYVVGSGIPHIYFKDYEQEKIYIPQNELQQHNITSVLQSIDEEIGNEIKQLKNYELLKKYLLKNMFV